MNARISILFGLLSTSVLIATASVGAYDLDMDPAAGPPHPSRVDIYVMGPEVGFDSSFTWLVTHTASPKYSTTNASVISALVHALYDGDLEHRIDNVNRMRGYTYHLLLFQDTNHTVMHFKVFEPLNSKTNLCAVYPVANVHTIYYNGEIGAWLHAHISTSTNAAPNVAGTNSTTAVMTNQSPKSP